MTNETLMLLTKKTTLALGATGLLFSIGCSCGDKAAKMQDNYARSAELQWKCCKEQTEPHRTECFAALGDRHAAVGALIAQWTMACHNRART